MARKNQKFKRTDFSRYSKLGVRRKKIQKYRKAKGIDNKIRLKMKGHVRNVSIGFKNENKSRGLVKNLKPFLIHNLQELKSMNKEQIGIIAKIGNKKRKEILDYAIKNNIKLYGNTKRYLEILNKKLEEAKNKKQEKIAKKLQKDKRAKKEAEKKEKDKVAEKVEKTNQDTIKKPENSLEIKGSENKKEIKSNNYGRGK